MLVTVHFRDRCFVSNCYSLRLNKTTRWKSLWMEPTDMDLHFLKKHSEAWFVLEFRR